MPGGALIFGMASPVHFTLLKKPESKDSGFFSSVENDHDSKVVLLVNSLLESLVASHGHY